MAVDEHLAARDPSESAIQLGEQVLGPRRHRYAAVVHVGAQQHHHVGLESGILPGELGHGLNGEVDEDPVVEGGEVATQTETACARCASVSWDAGAGT